MKREIVASGVAHPAVPQFASTDQVRAQAVAHARDRLVHSLETCGLVALAAQLVPPRQRAAVVRGDAAHLQDRRAGAADAEAAHVLPCQLMFGERTPWQLELPNELQRAFAARFCVTAALPAPFNHADSEAEACGLAASFVAVAQMSWSWRPMGDPLAALPSLLPQLAARLVAGAARAFADGAARKRAKDAAAGSRDDSARSEERLVEALILEAYAAGVPSPAELVRFVAWPQHAGHDYPWRSWFAAAPRGSGS